MGIEHGLMLLVLGLGLTVTVFWLIALAEYEGEDGKDTEDSPLDDFHKDMDG